MSPNANDLAKQSMDEEVKKFGFNRGAGKSESEDIDDEEDNNRGDLEDEESEEEDGDEESESEESEDEGDDESEPEDEEESEEDESEDEGEEEDDQPQDKKKKVIPFKVHNKLRKDLRDTQALLAKALLDKEELAAKLPDDFEDRVKALAAEIGVDNPDGLMKITKLMKEVAQGETSKIAEKFAKLEEQVAEFNKQNVKIVDEFPTEWAAFEENVVKAQFPNATPEQVKDMKRLMETLAKKPGVGGKLYTGENDVQLIDPYPLDYILYSNRRQFDAIVTGKKIKGMEIGKTQKIVTENNEGGVENKKLNKGSSGKDIMALDREYAQLESGLDDFHAPENREI